MSDKVQQTCDLVQCVNSYLTKTQNIISLKYLLCVLFDLCALCCSILCLCIVTKTCVKKRLR